MSTSWTGSLALGLLAALLLTWLVVGFEEDFWPYIVRLDELRV